MNIEESITKEQVSLSLFLVIIINIILTKSLLLVNDLSWSSFTPAMCEVIYNEGIQLKGTELWFDAKKKVNLSFISNGNISTLPRHDRIIATPETLKLVESKTSGSIALSCPYNRPFALGNAKIELIPSGYCLGASQIVVEIKDKRIVYTGDLKIGVSPTSKFIEIRRCDILIMKCRYGDPEYNFPPYEEVCHQIYEFAKESLYFNYTPVIFIDIFGKSLDLIQYLGNRNLKLGVHKSIYGYMQIYKELGFEFKNAERLKAKNIRKKVLVLPLHGRTAKQLDQLNKKRTCIVTGLAKGNEKIVKSSFNVDMAYAMSNHAGYDELIQYVEIVKPKEIYLLEGQSVEFSNSLKSRGYNAKPIEKQVQLKLL